MSTLSSVFFPFLLEKILPADLKRSLTQQNDTTSYVISGLIATF